MHIKRAFELFGGAERMVLTLMSELPDERFSVDVALLRNSLDPTSEFERQIDATGRPYRVWNWDGKSGFIKIAKELKAYCAKNRIDLIHSHDPRSNLVAAILSKITRIPNVASTPGWVGTSWRIKVFEFIDFLSLFFFERIITVSDCQRSFLIRRGMPAKKIKTIYCVALTVDTQAGLSKKDAKRHWGLDPETLVIGTVGRLSVEKGQHDLIHAFQELAAGYPSLRLLLAGDGDTKEGLQKLAQSLGVADRVIFTGFVEDVGLVYPAIDIYVCPSTTEGFPLSLQEAVAYKLPVVATDVGGNPELIKDEETGFLVPASDKKFMARRIRALIEDPAIAEKIRYNAYSYYTATFSQKKMIDQIRSLYLELLQQ